VVKRGAAAAGVKGAASPHMFRHLQATLLINAGAPMESVQKMLGHESPETTMAVYAHLMQETVESDIETFRAPVRVRVKG
jgi:integrase/recombinase XerD